MFKIMLSLVSLLSLAMSHLAPLENPFKFPTLELDFPYTQKILTTNNLVSIRTPITSESVSKTISELSNLEDTNEINLFLSTPGGSVVAGYQLVDYLKNLNYSGKTINCIADTAISMGFVIFQECPGERLVLPSSILMQHQMSSGFRGDLVNMKNDFEFTKRMFEKSIIKQAKRINITPERFYELIRDDWWLDGEDAMSNNVADKMVHLECSNNLKIKKEKVILKHPFFGEFTLTFSKCPLNRHPLSVESKNQVNLTRFDINEMLDYPKSYHKF